MDGAMIKQAIEVVLERAKECLRKKRMQEAIDLLESVNPASLPPHERACHRLLTVEVRLTMGNLDVDEELTYALTYFKQSADEPQFAMAKYLHGWLLTSRGDFFDARELLLEAYVMYKKSGPANVKMQARVMNKLGFICFEMGDFSASTQYLEKCISLYDQSHDDRNRLIVSYNLASIYYKSGNVKRAIDLYEKLAPSMSMQDRRNQACNYMQYAIALATKGDVEKAKSTIAKAVPLIVDLHWERAIYHMFLGWIYLLNREYSEALSVMQQALEMSKALASESSLIPSKRQMAEALTGLGRDREARTLVDDALRMAQKTNERGEIAACERLLAQLEARAGFFDAARDRFRQAMEMYSLIKAEYELAATRHLAGISGAYPNGERQALLYLAREYFLREGISRFVNEITAEFQMDRPHATGTAEPGRASESVPVIVTQAATMRRLVALAEQVAPSAMAVLLTGETGTGKDLIARYIHYRSGRAGRFVSVNAAAIPDSMIESELFGHRKGAFTNADRDKTGLIEAAHKGTLYLNEICDASPELQAKVLDAVERRQVRRLGETRERSIDFRLIAATNHDLEWLIGQKRFRIDLYHRISEVPIHLPPLRERREEIASLLEHFLTLYGVSVHRESPEFIRLAELLEKRDWPGNVRQLESEAKRLTLLSGKDISRMAELTAQQSTSPRERLTALLAASGWNRREVARQLGVSDTTVRRWIDKYNLYAENN